MALWLRTSCPGSLRGVCLGTVLLQMSGMWLGAGHWSRSCWMHWCSTSLARFDYCYCQSCRFSQTLTGGGHDHQTTNLQEETELRHGHDIVSTNNMTQASVHQYNVTCFYFIKIIKVMLVCVTQILKQAHLALKVLYTTFLCPQLYTVSLIVWRDYGHIQSFRAVSKMCISLLNWKKTKHFNQILAFSWQNDNYVGFILSSSWIKRKQDNNRIADRRKKTTYILHVSDTFGVKCHLRIWQRPQTTLLQTGRNTPRGRAFRNRGRTLPFTSQASGNKA